MPLSISNNYSPTIKPSCGLFYLDIYLSESRASSSPPGNKKRPKMAFINQSFPFYPVPSILKTFNLSTVNFQLA